MEPVIYADDDEDVQKAYSTIKTLALSPSEHKLFSCFVQDAVDPKAAALYVLQRASRGVKISLVISPTQVSAATKSLVEARDGGLCCITRRSSMWWDVFGWGRIRPMPIRVVPPEVIAGLETPSGASLREILAVFITEDGLQQLYSWLNITSDDLRQLRNTWTLAGAAAASFRTGRVEILPDWISGITD
ncbi:hypothetical protein V493_05904 [Pseudogymnoascus sp. VKM F-4281 (FW-2241)]|nr:hypothetical protein V493_05904 [Pseudogymnoascus sp. VKM F-4281 (FW-2241)]